eukprot:12325-Heterococcus_DN1.PRE.1
MFCARKCALAKAAAATAREFVVHLNLDPTDSETSSGGQIKRWSGFQGTREFGKFNLKLYKLSPHLGLVPFANITHRNSVEHAVDAAANLARRSLSFTQQSAVEKIRHLQGSQFATCSVDSSARPKDTSQEPATRATCARYSGRYAIPIAREAERISARRLPITDMMRSL